MSQPQPHHLAKIGFQRAVPSPALRPYIQWFWSIESNGRILEKRNEFMHPDGSLSLVFNWGDELEGNNGRYPQSVTLDKVGPYSQQLTLVGHVQAFGVLFRPGGAYPFFGIPMHELQSADPLRHLNLAQQHEKLAEANTFQEKILLLESWLINLLTSEYELAAVVQPSLHLIDQSQGKNTIQQVAESVYISERQLERLYKNQVGISPKKYARLIRLRQARAILKQANKATLAEIAHLTGYYDQAHFNREFKASIGLTPGAYISRNKKRQS